MRHLLLVLAALVAAPLLLLPAVPARADEGMWTFDNPPVTQLGERYDFVPDQGWLDHLRLAAVRFGDGGSGAFVSPEGLVLTNHHVARGQLQKVSDDEHDYVRDGFMARTRDQELPCPDLELSVLESYENVTDRVRAAVTDDMDPQQALAARRAVIAAIEKESLDETGLRSEVVSLYHGGEYWLYRYRTFTDVRLVFAPEVDAAYFGGDDDNFTYPRYDLDMALLRVYEDGEPYSPDHYLELDPRGARDGDLVFVVGNPASTDRLYTLAQLAVLRDHDYPRQREGIAWMIDTFREYAARGPQQARQADRMIFGLANGRKAREGELRGLRDPRVWAVKQAQEEEFRRLVAADPELQAAYGDAWDRIERALQVKLSRADEIDYRRLPGFRLPRLALQLVRLVQETRKPDGERLDGYHDAELASLRLRLFSPAPLFPEMEQFVLERALQRLVDKLGADDPFVAAALDGRSPADQARRLIEGTRLADPGARRAVAAAGPDDLAATDDPLLRWVLRLEPILREQHDWLENNVESVIAGATEDLGRARFAVYGKSTYPDATFTLRLSYGTVQGYPMNGTRAPYRTTFYGLFDRACGFDERPPYRPASRMLARHDDIELRTPLNFVCTCDIIGGNSGSPVVDREGKLVGLIFDGNIESLVGRFVYDGAAARAVAVHTAAIVEALTKLYDGRHLVDEMMK